MNPEIHTDPSFPYTPSFATNVKGTFATLRRQQRARPAASRIPRTPQRCRSLNLAGNNRR
jgi:hypothetical protein